MLDSEQRLPPLDSPELEALFAAVPLAALESSSAITYATDPEFRLTYVNPAWDAFAVANGAPNLARHSLRRMSAVDVAGPLRRFYKNLFGEAVQTDKPVEHSFLCHSAQRRREFRMRVLPLRSGGILSSVVLQVDSPHTGPAITPDYLNGDRIVTMCAHCRRTKRRDLEQWDWIPEYVANPPEQTSHGLCQVCLEFHYLSLKRR